jgi:isoquinoline 1-oxidoreductase
MPNTDHKTIRLSRRTFLQITGTTGAGLIVWACAPAQAQDRAAATQAPQPAATLQPAETAPRSAPPAPAGPPAAGATAQGQRTIPKDLDAWLRVGQDGRVSLHTGKVEFGQGIQTGFAQLVADELDLPFESIDVVMGTTDSVPYDGPTVGSQSTRQTGPIVRQAAAEMRQWLLELGSARLGVPPDQLEAQNGSLRVKDDPSRSISYAELAANQSAGRQISGNAPLKSPDQFTLIGQDIPRVDVPLKVNGLMKYGYDTQVPGMLFGKIVRPPSLGARLDSIDFSQAQQMPGVVGVFRDGDLAGLAAERKEQADAALATVRTQWTETAPPITSENIFDTLKSTADQGTVSKGAEDPDSVLPGLARRITVTVRAPYISHTPIEPQSNTVSIGDDGKVYVWSSTQAPFRVQEAVANALNKPLEDVVVTTMMSGGAFGRKSSPDPAVEAARLAQSIGRPVRINWTREEEFQFGFFRPAMLIELQAGLDDQGNIGAWKYDLYAAAYYPPGAQRPTRAAAESGIDATVFYPNLGNARTTLYQSHSPLPPYFWRANGTSVNALARETAIDQLAEMAGQDPVSFRRRLLANNPRLQAVLDAAVNKAGWQPGVGSTGQGIGIALDFTDETYIAEVARVAVDRTTGAIRVNHVDVAVDCGLVVNPGAARTQIEGSIVGLGLSSTLHEETRFASGRVLNNTFGQYPILTMREAPSVDVVFVEDKAQPMAGLGEPAVAPVSAAVSNAVYDAVGIRLRDLPFKPERVKAALQA